LLNSGDQASSNAKWHNKEEPIFFLKSNKFLDYITSNS
jgi:hypothetical protein